MDRSDTAGGSHENPQQADDPKGLYSILRSKGKKPTQQPVKQQQGFNEYVESYGFGRLIRTNYKRNADPETVLQFKEEGRDPRFIPLVNDVFTTWKDSPILGEPVPVGRLQITYYEDGKGRPMDEIMEDGLFLIALKVNRAVKAGQYRFPDVGSGDTPKSFVTHLPLQEYMNERGMKHEPTARQQLKDVIDGLRNMRFSYVVNDDGYVYDFDFAPRRVSNDALADYWLEIDGEAMQMFNPANHLAVHVPSDLLKQPRDVKVLARELYAWSHQYERDPNRRRRMRMRTFIRRATFVPNPEADNYTGTHENTRLSRSVMGPIIRAAEQAQNEAGYLKWWDIVPHGTFPENPGEHRYIKEHLIGRSANRKASAATKAKQTKSGTDSHLYPSYRDMIDCDFVYEFALYDDEWAADWTGRHVKDEAPTDPAEQQPLFPGRDDDEQQDPQQSNEAGK